MPSSGSAPREWGRASCLGSATRSRSSGASTPRRTSPRPRAFCRAEAPSAPRLIVLALLLGRDRLRQLSELIEAQVRAAGEPAGDRRGRALGGMSGGGSDVEQGDYLLLRGRIDPELLREFREPLIAPHRPTGFLSADRAHRSLRLNEPRLIDVVLELLAPDRLPDESLELGVRGAGAQRVSHVGFVQREQAGPQLAVGGQPDPVAVGTERLRDGIDEADLALAIGEAVDPRRGRALARRLDELVARLDRAADLVACEHLVAAPGVLGIQRHELDEADL